MTRWFSRGGIPACTWAATSASALRWPSGSSGLIFSSTIWAMATTCSMTARLNTPPSTLQLATRGLRLCQTGCGDDQFDITSEV